ncbi:MAG: xanthine dehydrogenase family protein molybdopterin-binding subunit, partial [Nitrospinota bacterium]|nr:xanthine dehydrogenase family protein molybdopterin-binding subunit [Nitrospinota bacterium]
MVIEHTFIGKKLPMVDAKEKVSGNGEYIADMTLPGMLHGRMLRSPHPHARILNIDASAAEKVPGVRAILTGRSSPQPKFGISTLDETPFAVDKVRYVGDEVAGVAAESEDALEEALSKIAVDYEEIPFVTDPLEALEAGAPLVHEDKPGNVAYAFEIERGDVDGAFQRADKVFEERYRTHLTHQAYLEPTGAIGQWNEDGTVTVRGPLQSPFTVREFMLAPGLGMPREKIQVIQTRSGGAFGGKLDVKLLLVVAFLAKEAGRPVRILLSPEEDISTMRPRVPARFHIRSAFAGDGKLLGKKVDVTADNGAYSSFSPAIASSMAVRTDSLYKTPNVRVTGRLTYTNTEPSGQFRGFGNLQASFCWESHLDTAAEGLGMDPLDLRMRNFTEPGETTVHGWRISTNGVRECVEKAAESIGWKEKRKKNGLAGGSSPGGASSKIRGVGLACTIHVTSNSAHAAHFRNGKDEAEGEVIIGTDGGVSVLSGEAELGGGAATVMALIAAEELGVDYRSVQVPHVDTLHHPFGLGTYASRATFMGGHATLLAARSARQALLQRASRVLEADVSELAAEDGKVFVTGSPARSVTFGEVIGQTGGEAVDETSLYVSDGEVPDPVTRYGHTASTYSFAAHAAEVSVDRETGEVTVERIACAHDLGRALNPIGAEGQIEGGVAMGVGQTLWERVVRRDGYIMNPHYRDYLLPGAKDVTQE